MMMTLRGNQNNERNFITPEKRCNPIQFLVLKYNLVIFDFDSAGERLSRRAESYLRPSGCVSVSVAVSF
jgi:hypothetical protein